MLWSRTFKTVRQQQGHAALSSPLVFGSHDELINDRLRDIHEVAKLRFPHHQTVRAIQAVAVLESKNTDFRKRTVVNVHRGLSGRQVLKRLISVSVHEIVQDRVTVAERTALAVLTRQPDSTAFDR